jgi:hypothetical protein
MMEIASSSRMMAHVDHARMLSPAVGPVPGSLIIPNAYFVKGIINYLGLRRVVM